MTAALLGAVLALSCAARAQNAMPGFGAQTNFPQVSTAPVVVPPSFVPAPVVASSAPVTAPLPGNLGAPVAIAQGGPWVVGEVLFFQSGALSPDYTLPGKVRAAKGALYTKSDVQSDVGSLMATGRFSRVDPSLFAIPSAPVPPEYATIATSTSEVRVVFNLTPKTVAVSTVPKIVLPTPVSGMMLTPTAYRGTARTNQPGLGLDFNALYIIGRLYGRNNYTNAPDHTNYLDRVGLWLLSADGKMEIQSESRLRPAMAVGTQGTLMFRDSPQPTVAPGSGPSVTANVSEKSTRLLTDAYFVASKKFGPVRSSAGMMFGDFGDAIVQFSEFLQPNEIAVYKNGNGIPVNVISRSMPFVSVLAVPHPNAPLGLEVIQFNGAAEHPLLFDLKAGYFLHMNFDLGLLKFDGGYDLLGVLQFRFNEFPR